MTDVPLKNESIGISAHLADVSTAGQIYVVVPKTGILRTVYSALNGAIATADAGITVKSAGTSVGTITIANSGSAAGDVDELRVDKQVNEGDTLEFETDGASTNTVAVSFTAVIEG